MKRWKMVCGIGLGLLGLAFAPIGVASVALFVLGFGTVVIGGTVIRYLDELKVITDRILEERRARREGISDVNELREFKPQPVVISLEREVLVEKIKKLKPASEKMEWLTSDEIEKYKVLLNEIKDDQQRKLEENKLTGYLQYADDCCGISFDSFKDLSDPITFEWKSEISTTYDKNSIITWLKSENCNSVDDIFKKGKLDEANIYVGFSKKTNEFVQQARVSLVNKKIEAQQAISKSENSPTISLSMFNKPKANMNNIICSEEKLSQSYGR